MQEDTNRRWPEIATGEIPQASELTRPRRPTPPPEGGTTIIGSSAVFHAALRYLPAVVESTAPVLILGETGTGKELVARKIHELGRCRNGPFVAINCAAIPAELFESELFGHNQGAFSGATTTKRGLLEVADGGTLLLDELGDLPASFQAKLLRVLEDKEVRRIGDTSPRRVDFRLISATHRDLQKDVAEGRFRRDLLYRINVFTLTLPRLRDRGDDLIELTRHFTALAAAQLGRPLPELSPAALTVLSRYPWPGNIRELANVIVRAVAVAKGGIIDPVHLDIAIEEHTPRPRGSLRDAVGEVERQRVSTAIATHQGNVSAAARELGVARQQLQRLMKKHAVVAVANVGP